MVCNIVTVSARLFVSAGIQVINLPSQQGAGSLPATAGSAVAGQQLPMVSPQVGAVRMPQLSRK